MTFSYPLPQDTRKIFTGARNECKCTNLSLLLDRYVGYEGHWNFNEKQKADLFKAVKEHFQYHRELPNLIAANYQRWQQIVQSFSHQKHFSATPEWRMVVGLGQASILETSMTIDRTTGIPIIPGSALKGLAASYALLCVLQKTNRIDEVEKEYQKYQKQEISALPENYQDFISIFGYQGEAGNIIFLDAVPTKPPKLEPDIMNNHYPDYYGDKTGRTAATPYQNPNPVYFLTLGKSSEFAFAVASRTQNSESQRLVDRACEWLQHGLGELGVGAKTAAGYGYLEIEE
jgi:CRISPR-associated protein Cmr6